MRQDTAIIPTLQIGNCGTGRLNDLPKVTHEACGGAWNRSRISQAPGWWSSHWTILSLMPISYSSSVFNLGYTLHWEVTWHWLLLASSCFYRQPHPGSSLQKSKKSELLSGMRLGASSMTGMLATTAMSWIRLSKEAE